MEFLRYGIPIMIAMVFVSFLWAWILTAVKPPEGSEGKPVPDETGPDWKYLDAGPEGIRKNVIPEIRRQTKNV